jgi:CheY-like chemotaxis protein
LYNPRVHRPTASPKDIAVTQTYRALAVDDDVLNYQLIRAILKDLPLNFQHATSGAEALDILGRETPDLITLDITLPDMTGWQILDQFKNDERFANSCVIVLTSHTEPVHRLIGNLMPIAAYLNKPVEPDKLRQIVRQCLNL